MATNHFADKVGRNVQRERKKAGHTQERLAKLAGLHRTTINEIENHAAITAATTQSILAIAKALHVPLSSLLD